MLILTRRIGETVIIGDDVDVTVLGVKGNQVRLGVKAPKEVTVHREEIYQRICQERMNGHPQANVGAPSGATPHRSPGALICYPARPIRRGGRVAEGDGLLNRYTV